MFNDPQRQSSTSLAEGLFGGLPFASPTPSMFSAEELNAPKQPNYSKKDVPMWTVEEDLLILKLHDEYGKRWSKIASHLPGRTDNGVRNRYNRMERAQVLRKSRTTSGYRCRRCGEPKRGHICAARSINDEAPQGEELHLKAAALTELSAKAMQQQGLAADEKDEAIMGESSTTSGDTEDLYEVLSLCDEPAMCADRTPPPTPLPTRSTSPTFSFKQPQPCQPTMAESAVLSLTRFSSKGDFLDELRHSLDDVIPMDSDVPAANTHLALPAPATSPTFCSPLSLTIQISNNTLQSALATLASADWDQIP